MAGVLFLASGYPKEEKREVVFETEMTTFQRSKAIILVLSGKGMALVIKLSLIEFSLAESSATPFSKDF